MWSYVFQVVSHIYWHSFTLIHSLIGKPYKKRVAQCLHQEIVQVPQPGLDAYNVTNHERNIILWSCCSTFACNQRRVLFHMFLWLLYCYDINTILRSVFSETTSLKRCCKNLMKCLLKENAPEKPFVFFSRLSGYVCVFNSPNNVILKGKSSIRLGFFLAYVCAFCSAIKSHIERGEVLKDL